MTDLIRAEGLVKNYRDSLALAGLDLAVAEGSVLGLLPPDGGRAEVGGHDVVMAAPAVRRVIGSAGQQAAVDGRLTGRENLTLIGRLHGLGRKQARRRADELLERFALTSRAN